MIDVNKPVTNPSLVQALDDMMKSNCEASQNEVINEILKAHFISPVTISPTPQTSTSQSNVVLKEQTTIGFNTIENEANQVYLLAFTDWDELRKWQKNEEQQTLIVTFEDLVSMLKSDSSNLEGFVINPHRHNFIIDRSTAFIIKEQLDRHKTSGVTEQVITKDTTVFLGQPKIYPKEMIDAISLYLKRQENVRAAYFQLMIKDGEESYLVIVDFKGEQRELFDGIGSTAKQYLSGKFIDMIPYDSDFGREASKDVKPFYSCSALERVLKGFLDRLQ